MDQQEGLRKSLKINDSIAAVLGIIGMISAQFELELFFEQTSTKPRYIEHRSSKILRGVQTFTTILLVIYIVRHSLLYFNFMKDKRRVLKESKIDPFLIICNFCSRFLAI